MPAPLARVEWICGTRVPVFGLTLGELLAKMPKAKGGQPYQSKATSTATLEHGQKRADASIDASTQSEAAELLNVSRKSVQEAQTAPSLYPASVIL
jgi:hypothetical protein